VGGRLSYAEAVAALESALTFGINPSLDGIRALADALGRPQDAFAVVQVTGTNGKTSVTRMCAALLAAEGLSTTAYTSPHLESYTERMELGGAPCTEAEFAEAVSAVLDAADATGSGRVAFTEFELLTAAALWLFRERGVDFACLEVGMGGRWDATSVVDPAVAVITGVGLDHTERLGATIEAIATDKAHIVKAGSSVVLGPGTVPVADVFLRRAGSFGLHPRVVVEHGAPSPVAEALTVRFRIAARPDHPGGSTVLDVDGVHDAYHGLALTAPSYQAPNVAVALAAAECALGRALRADAVRAALEALTLSGRFEVVATDPPVVLDGAHNPQAAGVLAEAIAEAWPDPDVRPLCLLGVLADKDARGIVGALAPVVAGFIATEPDSPRALPAEALAQLVEVVTGRPCPVSPLAQLAPDRPPSQVRLSGLVVTGSLYTVGQARALLRRPGRASADSDTPPPPCSTLG
jgi:dihydrofolate synthase/folylpolyglutamate synthase